MKKVTIEIFEKKYCLLHSKITMQYNIYSSNLINILKKVLLIYEYFIEKYYP